MKFVVIGAGTVGKWVVSLLATNSKINTIIVGDIDTKKAENVIKEVSSSKVLFRKVDITDVKTTAELIKGSDLVINTAGYQFNLYGMKSALKAGVNYVDPGGLFHITKEQYKLNDEFKKSGLIALLCMGAAPGNTNLMAKYGVDQLDSVDEIGVFDCVHDISEEDAPIKFSWHMDSVLDGLIKEPIIYKNGDYIKLKPFDGKEEIYLPDPIGRIEVIYRIHSEVFSLPISFKDKGIKFVYFKGGHSPIFTEKAKFLIDLGLADTKAHIINGKEIVPREILRHLYSELIPKDHKPEYFGILRVIVKGKKNRKKTTITIESLYKAPKGMDMIGIGTAMPLTVAGLMIARNEITRTGTLFPETCIDPNKYFKELKKMGIKSPIVRVEHSLV